MTTIHVAPPTALAHASTGTGNCVEVANLPGGHRAIRDGKNFAGSL